MSAADGERMRDALRHLEAARNALIAAVPEQMMPGLAGASTETLHGCLAIARYATRDALLAIRVAIRRLEDSAAGRIMP